MASTTMKKPTSSSSSSSSAFTSRRTYDVFLSFRGEDTRMGFTGNLYNALCQKGIHTFMDDEELRKGEEITPALIKAIQESRIVMVIFSENYASSTFCLEELVNIFECIKQKGRLVLPIFYQVDPSDVRHQKGSYAEALAKHERRIIDKEKVKKWRLALQEVANLSGWHFKHGYEYEFIRNITREVSKKINRSPLYVANHPVGLESRVQEVNSLLDVESSDGVHMIGVYGIGGIGKTTLACAVYNFIADQFDSVCFLANIRENSMKHGLVQVQETLLFELLGERDINLGNLNKGIPIIKSRFHRKKILLILDDVDNLEQLKALAGDLDWFGSGSRIIITTRDKHLLLVHGVDRTYEVKGLNQREALELFSWHAFRGKEVNPSYVEIAKLVVLYSDGLPLSLEIIGSNLFGKTMSEWKSALDTYERIPDENIQEILRVSYNGLKEIEKEIFLDIACFFRGYDLREVRNILLNGRGFPPEYGIDVLIDKCLIKIDQSCRVIMHDLIEDMGREIVRQESPSNPGKRSRLWFSKDVLHVLKENKGTDKIEIIMLHLPIVKEVRWDGNALRKMENLKILTVQNARFSRAPSHLPKSLRVLKWWGYPQSSLPINFNPKKLAILDLSMSSFTLDKQLMQFKNLKEMNLSGCQLLKKVPDMSGVPNLKELHIDYCENLIEVHDSVGFLDKLEYLNADECINLKILPSGINLTSLKLLSLRRCVSLKSFPEILGKMENIRYVNLGGSAIRELPFSIGNLIGLEYLFLDKCYWLREVPHGIFTLPKLKKLDAHNCQGFEQFKKGKGQEQEITMPSNVRNVILSSCFLGDEFLTTLLPHFHNVTVLFLDRSNITILPKCINACRILRQLVLDGCKQLREIKGVPPNIKYLSAFNCTSLTPQSTEILLTQKLHESGGTDFFLPGSSIPNWFNLCSREPSVSFWFRNKFPAITFCAVGIMDDWSIFPLFKFHVIINGARRFQRVFSIPTRRLKFRTDHINLCDLQLKFSRGELERVHIENGWNHVEISFMDPKTSSAYPLREVRGGYIKWTGVHVHEGKASTGDIRFTNPRDTEIAKD